MSHRPGSLSKSRRFFVASPAVRKLATLTAKVASFVPATKVPKVLTSWPTTMLPAFTSTVANEATAKTQIAMTTRRRIETMRDSSSC